MAKRTWMETGLRCLRVLFPLVFGIHEVTAQDLVSGARAFAERGEHREAIRMATQAIDANAQAAEAYYIRGREHFRVGEIEKSVADFDRYVALRPEVAARQWERGIACYYAGRYAEGARQFEMYQEFDGQDVENSVWRYLCLVPQVGVDRARATMLPIENDRRVPMMQVYELYRGRMTPDEVLAAARAGQPDEPALAARLFYAHLYFGLWYEAQGDKVQAARYVDLAAAPGLKDQPGINRYMWDVARIHQRKLRGELAAARQGK